jgi:hypothetical protein
MKKYVFFLLIELLAMAAFGQYKAGREQIYIRGDRIDDAYGNSSNPTGNYGSENDVRILSSGYRAYFRFDLSDIDGSISNVDSVALSFYREVPDTAVQMYFAPLVKNWDEAQVCWDNYKTDSAWSTGGGDFDSCGAGNDQWCDSLSNKGSNSANQRVYCRRGESGGLTQIVEDWIVGNRENYGLLIATDYAPSPIEIASTEYTGDVRDPYLYLEYTPAISGDTVTIDGSGETDCSYADSLVNLTCRGTEYWFYVYKAAFSGNRAYIGWLKFDLSGITGNVDSVSLFLHRKEPAKDLQVYFYRMTRDWEEEEATWDSASTGVGGVAWTDPGGDFTDCSGYPCDSLTEKGLDEYTENVYCKSGDGGGLCGLVQDWVDGTYPNYGLAIVSQGLGMMDTLFFYSDDNYNENMYPRPKLYIEYTPAETDSDFTGRRRKIIVDKGGFRK